MKMESQEKLRDRHLGEIISWDAFAGCVKVKGTYDVEFVYFKGQVYNPILNYFQSID